jgi:hypothetical protein
MDDLAKGNAAARIHDSSETRILGKGRSIETSEHRALLTAMLDTLVDGGVRGAGFVSKNFHAPVNSKG